MQVTRLTNVFRLTTAPTDLTAADPRTGGWTESIWTSLNPNAYNPLWTRWAAARSLLLPKQASIVGYRSALYLIDGNRLLPQGTSGGKWRFPGNASYDCDLPQVALELSFNGAGVANTSKPVLRGMPDQFMVRGEYQPTPVFKGAVTMYGNTLVGTNFGFIGRDLTQPTSRVVNFNAGVLTLDNPLAGAAVNQYIRLNRVYDSQGFPFKGSFRINAIVGAAYTLSGTPNVSVSSPSGLARLDRVAYFNFSFMSVSQAVVKKIGRPSSGYRGRRSKTRV